MKILTVRQPYAWLLIHGTKSVENRPWMCLHRGPLLIHAAKGMTRAEYFDAVDFVRVFDPDLAARIPKPSDLVRGAIIGTVEMVCCLDHSLVRGWENPWFTGPYGFVFKNPKPIEPIPAKGQLGIWNYDPPPLSADMIKRKS